MNDNIEFRNLRTLRLWLFAASMLAAGPAAAPVGAQSNPGTFVSFESGHVRPLALSPDGTRLFAVNTPDGRLVIYDVTAAGLALVGDVPVGMEPVSVAARTNSEVWVVNTLSDSVSIVTIDVGDPALSRVTRTLHTCDEPQDIVFAGPGFARAFVTAARRGQNCPVAGDLTTEGIGRGIVQVFDSANLGATLGGTAEENIVVFGDKLRTLAASPDGATVYAAVLHSGTQTTSVNQPTVSANGGLPAPPAGALGGGPEVGLIVKWNPSAGRWEDEEDRDWSASVPFFLPDEDVFEIDAVTLTEVDAVSGVGAVLFGMAVHPSNGRLYVGNTDARNEVRFEGIVPDGEHGVRGHIAESRVTIVDAGSPVAVHLNPHINYSVSPGPKAERDQSVAFPRAFAFSADGSEVFVAAFGSRRLAVYSTTALEGGTASPTFISTGGGPSGLIHDTARDRLYVMNRFDHHIGIVTNLSNAGTRGQTSIVPLSYDPQPPEVRKGRRHLYNAAHSGHGDSACASCHIDGDMDDLAWDLGDAGATATVPNCNPFRGDNQGNPFHPLKGPMTTQSFRGMAGAGPMHWRGDRTGCATGGDSLNTDLAFKAFNPAFEGLLGAGELLPAAHMEEFANFALTLKYPPNPIKALDDQATAQEAAGESDFVSINLDGGNTCENCHRLPFGTDGFSTFEGETQEFKIAHMRNLYQKAGMFGVTGGLAGIPATGNLGDQVRGFGFLHDGSIATVFDFLNANVFAFSSDAQRREMEAFAYSFDTGLKPAVGQQVSLTSSTVGDAATVARFDLLLARSNAGDCELAARGIFAGEWRGAVHSSGNNFLTDRASEGTVSRSQLLILAATPGNDSVWTCVPAGTGVRAGIDRDGDGERDRDELDSGTRPDDPRSFSGSAAVIRLGATSISLRDDNKEPIQKKKRKFRFRANTKNAPAGEQVIPPAAGSAGDPTLHGGRLLVFNSNGSGERLGVNLPAIRWTALGSTGFKYTGGVADPVQKVLVRPHTLRITAGKEWWNYTLDEPQQGSIGMRLNLGSSLTFCSGAPAKVAGKPASTARNDKVDKFNGARKVPAPSLCPVLPYGSASRAFLTEVDSLLD